MNIVDVLPWNHSWRRVVTSSDEVATRVTDMWGRVALEEHVRCHTRYVCDACGQVRDESDCICDPAKAQHCAVRLAWMEESRH